MAANPLFSGCTRCLDVIRLILPMDMVSNTISNNYASTIMCVTVRMLTSIHSIVDFDVAFSNEMRLRNHYYVVFWDCRKVGTSIVCWPSLLAFQIGILSCVLVWSIFDTSVLGWEWYPFVPRVPSAIETFKRALSYDVITARMLEESTWYRLQIHQKLFNTNLRIKHVPRQWII